MDLPEGIPLIDVSACYADDPTKGVPLANRFRATLVTSGFAYLTGHKITPDLEAGVRHAARRFFSLPMAEKRRLAINEAHRGYMAPNSSLIVTSSVARVSKPNQSESIIFLHDSPDADEHGDTHGPLQGHNQWPDEQGEFAVAGFRAAINSYRVAIEDLARRLTRVLALSLGVEADRFDPDFTSPTTWFRLLHYPPQEPEAGLFGSAPHTDYGFVTLLAQDDVGGLEVRPKGRTDWIPAPPIPGTLVMNVGDMLERWSNGLYPSTPHRVTNLSGCERYSHPFFFDPGLETVVEPLPVLGTPKFQPVCFGDYVMERLDKNYAYRRGRNL